MSRLRTTFLLVLLGALLTGGPLRGTALAQEGDDEESRRELAKQIFMQANEAAREGRYRAAVDLYDRALKLAPDVGAIHRNLALVYQTIARCDKAIAHFDRYLELRPDAADAEAILAARDQCRAVLEANPDLGRDAGEDGTLTITCNVEGAAISIDGVVMGQTPLQPLNLKPGSYNILVRKEGYEPWQRRIPIQPGRDVVINIALIVKKGTEEGPEEDPYVVWKWVTIGAGGALVATGVVFTVLAELDRAEFEDAKRDASGAYLISMRRAADLEDSVNTKRLVSYVLYGVGAAALIGGVTWLLVDRPAATETTEEVTPVTLGPMPGGAILTFTHSF